MKRKIIVGILFLMLFSTMLVSATNIEKKEKMVGRTAVVDNLVDVPVWEKGDSWVFNEHYNEFIYNDDGTIALGWYHNCTSTYTVIDDIGDTYKVKLTSKNNEGSFIIGPIQLKYTRFTKLTQELEHRKTDLAYLGVLHQEKGPVFWLFGKIGIPIPAYYSLVTDYICTPAFELFPFPITQGKTGIFSNFTTTGHQKISLYFGLIKLSDSDFSYETPAKDYICEIENITVPAGTYDAYRISTDEGSEQNYSRHYYVPEVGFYAKVSNHLETEEDGKPLLNYEHELVSTTYKP